VVETCAPSVFLVSMASAAVSENHGKTEQPKPSRRGGYWHCQLCHRVTPPVLGGLITSGSARHHCRPCGRTVCNDCNVVLDGVRTCRDCYLRTGAATPSREKFVFLVRHAQSTWNRNVDLVKSFRGLALEDISVKDVVSGAANIFTREVWHRDHPISDDGVRQTQALRSKIAETKALRDGGAVGGAPGDWLGGGGAVSSDAAAGGSAADRRERAVRRYYETFLPCSPQDTRPVYCSPLLRALETAHLALPEEDGWGSIKLLQDARELLTFVFERDCLGCGVGGDIAERAMRMGHELPGLNCRVDSADCAEKWWSDEPETDAAVEKRLRALWRQLLYEDAHDSCVLVTHSNLIKALLMRFGEVAMENDDAQGNAPGEQLLADENSSYGGFNGYTTNGNGAHVEASVEGDDGSPAGGSFCSGSFLRLEEGEEAILSDEVSRLSWELVSSGPEALRRVKTERLQNCGVLGLRCELEPARPQTMAGTCGLYPEVDGWIDVDARAGASRCSDAEPRWIAKDALLMFDSVLVK